MKVFQAGSSAATALYALLIIFACVSNSSRAALVAVDIDGNAANGHEGVYDDVLDITWLADANLAASNTFGVSGISAGGPRIGSMSWYTAHNFVAAINAANAGAGYLGVSTWRLPGVTPLNGNSFAFGTVTYDGSTDRSYNLSAPLGVYNPAGQSMGFTGSELAYHYYNNFQAIAECSGTGTNCVKYNTNEYGVHRAPDPNNYRALFSNIQSAVGADYWAAPEADAGEALNFTMFWGSQRHDDKSRFDHVWVVASGNMAGAGAVPLPAGIWLFLSSLAALKLSPLFSNRAAQPLQSQQGRRKQPQTSG